MRERCRGILLPVRLIGEKKNDKFRIARREISEEGVEVHAPRNVAAARLWYLRRAGLGGNRVMILLQLPVQKTRIKHFDKHFGNGVGRRRLQYLWPQRHGDGTRDTIFILHAGYKVRNG